MVETMDDLKRQLEGLTAEQRAELAHFLIRSLDEETEDEADVEAAWEEEVARRVAEIKAGKVVGKPVEQVFEELRREFS